MHAHLCRHLRPVRWLQVGWRSRLAPPVACCFLVLLSCCSRSLSELLFYEAGSHLLPTVCHTWTFSDSHIKAGVAEERPEIAVGSCYSCRLDLCLFFSFLRIQCFQKSVCLFVETALWLPQLRSDLLCVMTQTYLFIVELIRLIHSQLSVEQLGDLW